MKKAKLLVVFGVPDDKRIKYNRAADAVGIGGNTPLSPLRNDQRISMWETFVSGPQSLARFNTPSPPDVVLNGICSYEGNSIALSISEKICNKAENEGIKVINHPRYVRSTGRGHSALNFKKFDQIVVPNVTHLLSPSIDDVNQLIHSNPTPLPLIVRTTVDHGGSNMIRIHDRSDAHLLESMPFDGRDYYAIEYVDYKDAEDTYTKFRLIKVGEKIFGRNMYNSEHWNVHASDGSKRIVASPELKKKEKQFLESPKRFMGEKTYKQLVAGLKGTGLDYVALDFALLPDGKALFFECNSCFLAFSADTDSRTTESNRAERRITTALSDLIVKAAKKPSRR